MSRDQATETVVKGFEVFRKYEAQGKGALSMYMNSRKPKPAVTALTFRIWSTNPSGDCELNY